MLRAGADVVDLLGEGVQHGVDRGRLAGLGDVRRAGRRGPLLPRAEHIDLGGQHLDLLGQGGRRGDRHGAAELLQLRAQIRIAADPPQLRDLGTHRIEALREALDPLRVGERADQATELREFREQPGQDPSIGIRGGGRSDAVEAFGQPPDILRDAGVDVLGHFLGQVRDLRANLLDRPGDGGEIGPGPGPLDALGEREDGLPQGVDVVARGEPVDRLAQAHDLVLQLRQNVRRCGPVRGAGDKAPGEIQAHARDHAAIRGGTGRDIARDLLRQLPLALADVLDRAADVGGGRARAATGLTRGGDLLAELRHPALDVAEPLGHLLDRSALEGALDPGLDLGEPLGLGQLRLAPVRIQGPVEAVEPIHQRGDAVTVGLGDGVARGRRRRAYGRVILGGYRAVIGRRPVRERLRSNYGFCAGQRPVELLRPEAATVPAVARRCGLRLRHDRGDPRLKRNPGPGGDVAGGVEHFGIETVELRHRGAGHRWPVVGSVRRPILCTVAASPKWVSAEPASDRSSLTINILGKHEVKGLLTR